MVDGSTSMDNDHEARCLTILIALESELDAEPEEIERLARQLRAELSQLEIETLRPAGSGPAPHGSKGTEILDLGAWLITLSASGGVFVNVIHGIKG